MTWRVILSILINSLSSGRRGSNFKIVIFTLILWIDILTRRGRDKMEGIFQTKFSNALSWMKMYQLRLKISLMFVPKGPINNIPALVPIMAWRRPGDKPLSEPMMVSLPTHICKIVVRWVPWNYIDDKSTLVQVMAWCRQATSHYLNQCWPKLVTPPPPPPQPWEPLHEWTATDTYKYIVIFCTKCGGRSPWVSHSGGWCAQVGSNNYSSGFKPH